MLLVVYLVVMTIILLNLLIAVLSTSHAKVQRNAEREFQVSKARQIRHYQLVVEEDLLPAPFNLAQLRFLLPLVLLNLITSGTRRRDMEQAIGLRYCGLR